ncbi:hypothetical protein OSG_eHP40_00025 [environmental Halophage eHP-40]|nr:hypothetical protein OSG_eHP40_00025 [environmental Halophage eHP-40]
MPVQFEIDTTDQDIATEFEDAFFEYLMDAATVGYNHALELAPEDRGTLKQTSLLLRDAQMGLSTVSLHHMLRHKSMEPNRIIHHYNHYWSGHNESQAGLA